MLFDLMKTALGKLVLGALSVTAGLVWFSWSDGAGGHYESRGQLPEQVFEGGVALTIQYEVNQPARLTASFARWDLDGNEEGINVDQQVRPGYHVRSVAVPEDAYVYLELQIDEPPVGSKIDWKVLYDEQLVYQEALELDEPLEAGYAFFTQFEVDSVTEIKDWLASR